MNTADLIQSLAAAQKKTQRLVAPKTLLIRLLFGVFVYAAITAFVQEIRPDLMAQLQRPFYLIELASLLFLLISSLAASVYLVFPDHYQQEKIVRLPLYALGVFLLVFAFQLGLPPDAGMVIDVSEGIHTLECTLCILGVAVIPSILLTVLGRKGATTKPMLLGAYSILAATSIGWLLLRVVEMQDDPLHLLMWHYLPMLGLATLGAALGKIIFKW